ncbi:nucleotide 5'-monophosphate nucleosidase PpnN [Litoribacillus peritrichatus]|uniref:AMP nucleosidase n=1 Tax=Litoribacillus peritrichatus TaxID=718191 RepID=A0ABP7N5Q0_9GAMM
MPSEVIDYSVLSPVGSVDVLSMNEVNTLSGLNKGKMYEIFRRCALAVMNSGIDNDDIEQLENQYRDFDINIVPQARGACLEVQNAPARAFVDGKMIQGVKENLYSVLRDIIYLSTQLDLDELGQEGNGAQITEAVFHTLRQANALKARMDPNIIVCWGGHSIGSVEYDYTKEVGYQLGLRGFDICTGCGPGAMKGPMKGANVAHVKQRIRTPRYIGLTEPGIIAAESPNPIVNELIIMPDIEKRLEAFIRLGHGIVVFPGGAGTAEEILYLLGVLMGSDHGQAFPVYFTAPKESADYFIEIDEFIGSTLGPEAQKLYEIIIADPEQLAITLNERMTEVKEHRKSIQDAFYFNWLLKINEVFQEPFVPTHKTMSELDLHMDQPPYQLASQLRRAMSGIVAGNVKEQGIAEIHKHGPFKLHGDKVLMQKLDKLLKSFVRQKRMKLPGSKYVPCYEVITD